jgi:quercetin 2,3-dioxygenase
VFVLEGVVQINNTMVNKRDALGVYNTSSITIETAAESRLLIMEVPML